MAIDFPNSPTTGDIHTVSGKQWQWDSEKWTAYGVSLSPGVLKVDSGNSRVGINQTSPTVALDVTGSARITGDLTVSGTTVTVDAATILAKDRIVFEGATADSYETTLLVTDPTADRTLTLPNSTGTLALTGAAVTAVTVADTTDTTCFVALWESATGDLGPKSDAGITYNAGTGMLTATGLTGPLTGNAATTTALANARTIGGTSFDGTANIAVALAATSTALATGRTINGVSFDGTANITVVDSAALPLAGGTLSGTVNAADQILQRPVMKDYAETKVAMAAHAVDLALGNVQTYTLSGNQTLTFTNPPASGSAGSFTLLVTNGASATLTWPTSVDWAGGTAPTLTASGVDVLTFLTVDGGTIWYGFAAGLAMA
jgi:hypothetical protein